MIRPTAVQLLSGAAATAIVLLVPALYLVGDSPRSGTTLFGVLVAAAGACAVPIAGRSGFAWRDGWPYAAYAAALLAVWALRPTDQATAELGRQALFLTAVFGTAVAARAAAFGPLLVGVHVASAALVLLQIAGPSSGIDHLGRAGFYHALEQWSGYPEIGLVTALGGAMTAALALAARAWPVRLAAALLTAAFGAATILLQSRSATLTLAIVVVWLTAVAAVRWRGRVSVAGAVVLAGALVWVLATGPGPAQIAGRASAGLARETQIRQVGWEAAGAMFRAHPLAGVGLGGYRAEYFARGLGDDASHAYNLVLHVAAETGMLGLVTYLLVWGRALGRSLRAAGRSLDGVAAFAAHAALAAFFVRSQSEHFLANLDTSFRTLLLVGVLIGLAEALGRRPAAAGELNARSSG